MSSIAKDFPVLEYLNNNSYIRSPTFKKHLSRSLRIRNPNPDALYMGYLIGIGSLDEVNPDSFSVMLDLDKRWPRLVPKFRSQIAIVSESFADAIEKSKSSLDKASASTKSFLSGKNFCGTMLFSETKVTISYSLTFNEDGLISDYNVLWLDRIGSIMGYVVPEVGFISRSALHMKNGELAPKPVLDFGYDSLNEACYYLILFVRTFILFCHFADIDIKYVARAGSREARKESGNKNAYVNDSRFSIRHLTANYFTEICNDSGFPVRGHFRLQRVGEDLSERKLIFISPFMKKGYHRKAELLTKGEFGSGIKV